MVPTSPYSQEEDIRVPLQLQHQNNVQMYHLSAPPSQVLSVNEVWRVRRISTSLPGGGNIRLLAGIRWARGAETVRDPCSLRSGQEWRLLLGLGGGGGDSGTG